MITWQVTDMDRARRAHRWASPRAAQQSTRSPASDHMLTKIGAGEGALNIIVWAGYAEAGQDDPDGRLGDAVPAADRLQGQRQDRQHVGRDGGADGTGQYDGVSASGNATLRLMAGGTVAPINVNLLPTTRTSTRA